MQRLRWFVLMVIATLLTTTMPAMTVKAATTPSPINIIKPLPIADTPLTGLIVKLKDGIAESYLQNLITPPKTTLPVTTAKKTLATTQPIIKVSTASLTRLYNIGSDGTKNPATISPPRLYLINTDTTTADVLSKTLLSDGKVDYVEKNLTRSTSAEPNDPYFSQQWALNNSGQNFGTAGADIQAINAWTLQPAKTPITVAVLDTGADLAHEDLVGNFWTNNKEIPGNGIDDDGNGYVDDTLGWNFVSNNNQPVDGSGHGTHVSGIIAATRDNNKGIAGICGNDAALGISGCKLMELKVCNDNNSCNYWDIIRGIVYAVDNGAQVINLSLGSTAYSQSEQDAITYAWNRGVVVVAAAGNNSTNTRVYPAANDHVLAVAATDNGDNPAYFSSYGDWVDLAAPGDTILSTTLNNGYRTLSGTSMASPHVAAVAALAKMQHPSWTNDQIATLLQSSATSIDNHYMTYAGLIGTGRVSAYAALANDNLMTSQLLTPLLYGTYNGAQINIVGSVTNWSETGTTSQLRWNLEFASANSPDTWTFLTPLAVPRFYPNAELLATWDIHTLVDGRYYLRFTANTYSSMKRPFPAGELLYPFRQLVKIIPINIDHTSPVVQQPGWPQNTTGSSIFSSPLITDLDVPGTSFNGQEVIAGDIGGNLYVWNVDGSIRSGFPKRISSPGDGIYGAISAADIDGDGKQELFGTTFNGNVFAIRNDSSPVAGWETPKQMARMWAVAPILADINNDHKLEVIVVDGNGTLNVWKTDGTLLWTRTLAGGVIHSTPAVADINRDGNKEIVIGTANKQLFVVSGDGVVTQIATTAGSVNGEIILADLDQNNSDLEIIVPSNNSSTDGSVQAFEPNGALRWQNNIASSLYDLAVGKLDSSKTTLSVVTGDLNGKVAVWDAAGIGGNIATLDSAIKSQPLVADFNGDGQQEILVTSSTGKVYVMNKTGTQLLAQPYPLSTGVENASPTIGSVDQNGNIEVAFGSTDGKVQLLSFKGALTATSVEWGTYHGNNTRTGEYSHLSTQAGDATLNGTISSLDAYYVSQYLAGSMTLSAQAYENGAKMWAPYDSITSADTMAILYCSASGLPYPRCLGGFVAQN